MAVLACSRGLPAPLPEVRCAGLGRILKLSELSLGGSFQFVQTWGESTLLCRNSTGDYIRGSISVMCLSVYLYLYTAVYHTIIYIYKYRGRDTHTQTHRVAKFSCRQVYYRVENNQQTTDAWNCKKMCLLFGGCQYRNTGSCWYACFNDLQRRPLCLQAAFPDLSVFQQLIVATSKSKSVSYSGLKCPSQGAPRLCNRSFDYGSCDFELGARYLLMCCELVAFSFVRVSRRKETEADACGSKSVKLLIVGASNQDESGEVVRTPNLKDYILLPKMPRAGAFYAPTLETEP